MRPLRSTLLSGLCVGWTWTGLCIEIGDTWMDASRELGEPSGRLEAGARAIYRWPEREVWVESGRVTRVVSRDLAAEQSAEVRRSEAAEDARRRDAARSAREAALAAEAAAREERERPERERREQAARIAELESERQALEAEVRRVAEERAKERQARILSLGKELGALRLAISRAREAGDTEQVTRLRGVLLAKDRELKQLQTES